MTCPSTLTEHPKAVTMKGDPLTLLGEMPGTGSKAPDARLVNKSMEEVSLQDFIGKPLLVATVPSLDTSVCDKESRTFDEAAQKHPDATFLVISMDLPFAQDRWCGAAGVKNIQTLSDYRHADFGSAYGLLIKELRLLARAVFVIGSDGTIQHQELVKEVTDQPDYDAALAALP